MNDRGFSLIETLLALSLVALALTGLAQLFAMFTRANADARRMTLATVLAGQKMEQLRGMTAALEPKSLDSLERNVAGLCDFLDAHGRSLGGDTAPPTGTIFVRRWSIESLPVLSTDTLILQVVVRHAGNVVRPRGDSRVDDEGAQGRDDHAGRRQLAGQHHAAHPA